MDEDEWNGGIFILSYPLPDPWTCTFTPTPVLGLAPPCTAPRHWPSLWTGFFFFLITMIAPGEFTRPSGRSMVIPGSAVQWLTERNVTERGRWAQLVCAELGPSQSRTPERSGGRTNPSVVPLFCMSALYYFARATPRQVRSGNEENTALDLALVQVRRALALALRRRGPGREAVSAAGVAFGSRPLARPSHRLTRQAATSEVIVLGRASTCGRTIRAAP